MADKKPKNEKELEKEATSDVKVSDAYAAEVLELVSRESGKQAVMMVRCKVLEGRDAGKIMRRIVLGPIRAGDILMLTQTEIEAAGRRGGRR
jgi:small subunit ribosomal protein S28e|tara:strand:- start:687 stop:962 length:276 start_codon:yes stop_codon:yes gene_type:complete